MNVRGFLTRVVGQLIGKGEGDYRPGPYYLPITGGFLPAGAADNWWQQGYTPASLGTQSAMVEACVSAYAQTVAMCPGDHWSSTGDGGRQRVTTSALARIIRSPNDYQSMSDLLLNLTRRLYQRGEAFALAIPNNRFEISELHWIRNGYPIIAEDGSIFYNLSGNEILERRFNLSNPIPARYVLHVRLHCPQHPLKGESPILAGALELAMSGAAMSQQVAFYLNQARPSFVLETDEKLTKERAQYLRELWNAQTQGANAGGTPIAAWGMKAKPISTGASDGQLADLLKMTDQHVALAFRMPLQVLGIGGTPFASTEALMASWKASGLGFVLNHIEEAFGMLFALKGYPDEYVEFDTNALLRSSFKELIDALVSGTRRVMTTNEARRYLDLPAQEGADEILVQQQDIPISLAGKAMVAPAAPGAANGNAAADGADGADGADQAAKQMMLSRFRSSHAREYAA
jgi:HK97 family phage portal protein